MLLATGAIVILLALDQVRLLLMDSSTVTTGGIADTNDFHDVILSGSGTSATQSSNAIDIDGDFTISSSGTWETSNLCIYVSGNTTIGSGTLINTIPTLSSSIPVDGATGSC